MITVTDTARNRIKQTLARRGKGVGIRIGVRTTGCSGLAYVLEYVDTYEAEVGVTNFAHDGFIVLIDAKSLVPIVRCLINFFPRLNKYIGFS
jgi:iron-sulfur cluster assembly protein